jgi:hypothetical protein
VSSNPGEGEDFASHLRINFEFYPAHASWTSDVQAWLGLGLGLGLGFHFKIVNNKLMNIFIRKII